MATVKRFQTIIDSRSYFEGSFGDIRLDKLAVIFFFRMSVVFGVVLRKLSNGEKALEMAFNRLLKNPRFSQETLIKNVCDRTAKIISETSSISHILCNEKSRAPGPITMKVGLQVLKSIQQGWALKNV